MRLSLVTPPAAEPLSLTEVKLYRRIDASTEDDVVEDLIASARELFEGETGRQVITATWRLELDRFPFGREPLVIPKAPLLAVSSVAYLDASGASQTWSSSEYTVRAHAGPFAKYGSLYPNSGYCYPTTLPKAPNAVTVTFTAGYGASAANVPQSVRSTIQVLVGDLYEQREGTLVGSIATELPATRRALHRYRLPVYA